MTPLIGQQQGSQTDPWLKKTVDLSTYAGQTISLRFRSYRGTSYAGDMAIDDFHVRYYRDTYDVDHSANRNRQCAGYLDTNCGSDGHGLDRIYQQRRQQPGYGVCHAAIGARRLLRG
ncbi:hypothetical protein B1H10_01495 [candidate division KSB1 bacterium 4484_188]|nr:MAG: hypothetical protein B1H10_01495 [candidate division KSB1 bacterium 4484_188]